MQLDEIEYCLGLERGDIKHYNDEDLLRAEREPPSSLAVSSFAHPMVPVHSDMAKLSKDAQWALVPSGDALQSMIELFEGNHAKNPSNRTLFKDVRFGPGPSLSSITPILDYSAADAF